jgi:hypothetical protein
MSLKTPNPFPLALVALVSAANKSNPAASGESLLETTAGSVSLFALGN